MSKMSKYVILLFIIISIIIIFLILNNNTHVTKQDIINMFNNTSYHNDGAPQGGFLISMIDMTSLCDNYKWTSTNNSCLKDPNECGKILNIADIDDWLTTILSGGTNCYNLATTYWRKDMPQYVFGPYKTNDMTIGVILDINKLFDYIGCLYPMDSGTIGRYNDKCKDNCCNCENKEKDSVCYPDIDTTKWITKDKSKRKDKWTRWLKTKDSTLLGMAGCGKMATNDTPSGLYNLSGADQWINVTRSDAQTQLSSIQNIDKNSLLVGPPYGKGENFSISNKNSPFDKYNWDLWVEATKKLYNIAQQNKEDLIISQLAGGDGYRENEVDLIIPNKTKDCNGDPDKCHVQEDFKKIFINSIMGIFSFAEDNCSNSKLNKERGPGGVGCVDNITCNIQNDPDLPNSIGRRTAIKNGDSYYANPFKCIKQDSKNCYDQNDKKAWCYYSQNANIKCCCSTDFSEKLVKKIVKQFNNSDLRKNSGAKMIHGYKVRCNGLYDFSYILGQNKDINITQIT